MPPGRTISLSTEDETPDTRDATPGVSRAGERSLAPLRVWFIAVVAALLHMLPFWHAQWSTQPGYEFTGNLTISPDYMQYRVWERLALREGPIVSNTFTVEPNRPHLPVFYYWAIGKTARAMDVRPETVYAYSGAVFAIVLTILVWVLVRRFLPDAPMRWWVFLALMFGGGLGGHLKLLASAPVVGQMEIVQRTLIEPADAWPLFEDYRGHYIFRALYDSHFLLLWIVALLAILALARASERYSTRRAVVAALGFAAMTLLHVYEGVTLVAIAAAGVVVSWRNTAERTIALRLLGWTSGAVALVYVVLGVLVARSGLPIPEWRAVNILFSTVVLAFPIAWWLITIGLRRYWREAGPRERFLVAWAAACTLLTLSGPFYPYPDRGTLTMAVPVLIIAGSIFASRFGRPSGRALALAAAVFAAGPLWQFARSWHFSGFRADAPSIHLSADRRAVLDTLGARAQVSDVLLAEPPDLLWLAPEYPGRLYVGHFFLTHDYRSRREALERALASPDSLGPLLDLAGARWLFAGPQRNAETLAATPGLAAVWRGPSGTLFEVRRPAGRAVSRATLPTSARAAHRVTTTGPGP
jgi:hypothetical protein